MTIRADKPLRDIFALPEFAPMKGQFIASASDWFAGGKEAMTLSDLGRISKHISSMPHSVISA